MGLKNMLEKPELKKILEPIKPTKYQFTNNLEFFISSFSKKYTLLAPNNLTNKSDGRLVGIAFDYMARFIIAKNIENNKSAVLEDMVCEKALDKLKNIINNKKLNFYKTSYTNGIMTIKDYIINKSKNYSNVLPFALLFAKLEQIQRLPLTTIDAKSILESERTRDLEMEEDLKNNCEVFEKKFIKSKIVKKDSIVVFNPHFGIWSIKCFGADADVFIDGVLYDFKCTSTYGYRSSDVLQICGYYLLHKLSQSSNNKEYDELAPLKNMDFKAIALYKSRFGVIERFDVDNFEKEKLEEVIEQTKMFIEKYYYFNKIMPSLLIETYLENKDK